MCTYMRQTFFAGDLVVYFDTTGIRVFPVPELTNDCLDGSTIHIPEFDFGHADVSSEFSSLPRPSFNIDRSDIWESLTQVSFPTAWDIKLGMPFVFDTFFSKEADEGDADPGDLGMSVSRYSLDIQWDRSTPSRNPTYTLSLVDTFTLTNGSGYYYGFMCDMDIDAFNPLNPHSFVEEIHRPPPPPQESNPDDPQSQENSDECSDPDRAGFTSYVVVRKSDPQAVERGLAQASSVAAGRETTAVVKMCTVVDYPDDGNDWSVCGRSGRAAGARTVPVPKALRVRVDEGQGDDQAEEGEEEDEDEIYNVFYVYDFISG